MKYRISVVVLITSIKHLNSEESAPSTQNHLEPDPNGYIYFCLCMGRFGNQMEHFLGGMAFAKELNRTLIIPPLRTYKNVEFNEWFDESGIQDYHRSLVASEFMHSLAPQVWPQEKRAGFCFEFPSNPGCQVKKGNPFANFWDEQNIDFDFIQPFSISYQHGPARWNHEFPPDRFPVIALKGAPASFPMKREHLHLQKHIIFSHEIRLEAEGLLEKHFGAVTSEYLAIHLRNGKDWEGACPGYVGSNWFNFMAGYQCHNWDPQFKPTMEMCLTSEQVVVNQVKQTLERTALKRVLIATDKTSMAQPLQAALGALVTVVHPDPWLPVVDAYLLSHSKHFIGNCVSSFSAFVRRQRDSHHLGVTEYFANV